MGYQNNFFLMSVKIQTVCSFFFCLVLLYKVAMNTELANAEPAPGENTGLGSCESLVTTFSLTN